MIHEFDIFLSHASEDKDNFINSLYTELTKEYRVWYDEGQIPWGSKLDERIQDGLNKSKYGIVVLSDKYLSKHSEWIKQEFETISNSNKLCPILHKINIQDIEQKYPVTYEVIKNILAISSEDIINNIIKAAKKAIGEDSLCSKRNIDYTELRDLLNLSSTTREKAAKKTFELIKNSIIPSCLPTINNQLWNEDADFNTINRLWLKYTNGYISKYDLKYWEPYVIKLAENEKVLIHTIMEKQLYDIDKITVTGDKASEVQGDYTTLRDLLKAENFSEADTLTAIIINILLDILNLSSLDLRTIDQLWLSASNGKFGLSVQKSVWIDVCNQYQHEPTTYNHKTWKKFISKVGWDKSLFWDKRAYQYSGHLPSGIYVLGDMSSDNLEFIGDNLEFIITFHEKLLLFYQKYFRSSPEYKPHLETEFTLWLKTLRVFNKIFKAIPLCRYAFAALSINYVPKYFRFLSRSDL